MKGNRRMRLSAFTVFLASLLVCTLLMRVDVAYAAQEKVAGMDYYYGTGESATDVDVLSVTGSENDTVFIEMEQDGRTIASHLAFTLGDDTAEQRGTDYVGVVSVSIANFNPTDTYTIRVYADRQQSDEVFSGTITPVYARIGANERLIALRTMGAKEDRAFNAPGSVSFDNATYELKSGEPASVDPLIYEYELVESDEVVDGSITYVDDEGNVLKKEELGGIAQGASTTVSVPQVITVGEGSEASYWRTVSFGGTVTAANPGVVDFVVPCKPLTFEAGNNGANFYFATIELVDDQGNRLATDTLNVTGTYRYTAPARLHLTGKDGLVTTYALSEQNDALNSSGVLVLDPSSDNVTTGEKTYTISYEALPSDAEATWTVVLVNGSADPKSEEREISRETFVVRPGETKTYECEKQLEVNGTAYVPVASTKDEYRFTYGAGDEPVLNIYYVPDGYVAPEPYEIAIRYVNIANNEVLQSHTLTSRPEDRDELEITSVETFTQGGIEYVRLDGQDKSLFHSYYSSNRAYNIYYRDINDDLSASIVITRLNVEYEDLGTTVVDNGSTVGDEGTQGTEGTIDAQGQEGTQNQDDADANDATYEAALPVDEGLTIINGDNNALVTNSEGTDTNTMRIEDDETPLAQLSNNDKAAAKTNAPMVAGIGAALAVVAGLFLLLFFKRRKNKNEDAE